jgi:hypothetical protein
MNVERVERRAIVVDGEPELDDIIRRGYPPRNKNGQIAKYTRHGQRSAAAWRFGVLFPS